MLVSYEDNLDSMAQAAKTRDYKEVRKEVLEKADTLDVALWENESLYGFKVYDNAALTKITGFPVKVVRFFFSDIDTLHNEAQEGVIKQLFARLSAYYAEHPAYYNLRVPLFLVDVIKCSNLLPQKRIFCGGTQVFYATNAKEIPYVFTEGVDFITVDEGYVNEHFDELIQITEESFSEYQGQYHISPIVEDYARDVYINWIKDITLTSTENMLLVAEVDHKAIGYAYVEINGNTADLSLTAVNPKYRGRGIYRSLIMKLMEFCKSREKLLIAATQMDNYGSQTTWTELGMKPYFGFYNIHYDMRTNQD